MVEPVFTPTSNVWEFPIFPHLHQPLVLSHVNFCQFDGYGVGFLICISLILVLTQHPFVCLLTTGDLPVCLLSVFPLNCFFCFVTVLYIIWILILSWLICTANTFFPSIAYFKISFGIFLSCNSVYFKVVLYIYINHLLYDSCFFHAFLKQFCPMQHL